MSGQGAGWIELVVRPVPREAVDDLSSLLWDHGVAGVQERDPPELARPPRQPWDTHPAPPPPRWVELVAWLEGGAPEALEAAVRARLPGAEVVRGEVPEVDWVAAGRAGFAPLVVSERLVIAPPWDAPPGSVLVEPGVGFGTGDHPSTRGALVLLEALATPGLRALDVGCGSGILALAAVHLGLHAEGIDVDAEAVEGAKANARLNHRDLPFSTTPLHRVPGTFDVVLGNLHAELLEQLATDLLARTGDHLVLAGILDDREDRVRACFDGPLGPPVRRLHDAPWVALHYRRSSA